MSEFDGRAKRLKQSERMADLIAVTAALAGAVTVCFHWLV